MSDICKDELPVKFLEVCFIDTSNPKRPASWFIINEVHAELIADLKLQHGRQISGDEHLIGFYRIVNNKNISLLKVFLEKGPVIITSYAFYDCSLNVVPGFDDPGFGCKYLNMPDPIYRIERRIKRLIL